MEKKNDLVPFQIEMRNIEDNLRRMNDDMDMVKLDLGNQREHLMAQMRDVDGGLKSATNQTFLRLKDLETQLVMNKTEATQMQEKMAQELMELERDIDDLRGKSREMLEIGKQESMGKVANHDQISGDANKKIELLVEETNQLWNFLQNYVDEQAWKPFKYLRSADAEIEKKMNQMEWLSKMSPYLSPDVIAKLINAFKEQYNTQDQSKRASFISCVHRSSAVLTVIDTL